MDMSIAKENKTLLANSNQPKRVKNYCTLLQVNVSEP